MLTGRRRLFCLLRTGRARYPENAKPSEKHKKPHSNMHTTRRIASTTALLLVSLAAQPVAIAQTPSDSMQSIKAKLQTTLNQHLNKLLSDDGSVVSLKGKTADGSGALAFYLMFEITGEQKFPKAAPCRANQVWKEMRAPKFGGLPTKEKDKPSGEKIIGGGPPALGAYAAGVAYI